MSYHKPHDATTEGAGDGNGDCGRLDIATEKQQVLHQGAHVVGTHTATWCHDWELRLEHPASENKEYPYNNH